MEQLRTLEEISRELVGVQLKIAKLKKKWEKELLPFDQKGPAAQVAAFAVGPPQALKIVVPLYAPKFQVHPGLFYSLNRAEPSTYQQVRSLWFTCIWESIRENGEKLSGLKTFGQALVWITVYFPDDRARDVDNFNFTAKFIIDALVAARVLEGDDHSRVAVVLEGAVDRENPRTEIIIMEDVGKLNLIKPSFNPEKI